MAGWIDQPTRMSFQLGSPTVQPKPEVQKFQSENYTKELYSDECVKDKPCSVSGLKNQKVSEKQSNSTTETNDIDGGLFAFGEISEHKLKFLIDTGASISVLSRKVFDKLPESQKRLLNTLENKVLAAGGTQLANYGTVSLEFVLNNVKTLCEFLVADIFYDGIEQA